MALADFRYVMRFRVPFCNVDMMQHVNHASYIVWSETVRAAYFGDVIGGPLNSTNGIILARLDNFVRFNVPEIYDKKMDAIWARVCHDHPGWDHLLSTGEKCWYKLSDFLNEADYHRTAMYNELYRHQDVEENFGTLYRETPSSLVGVSLHRDRRSFTESDRLALNLIQPHIIRARRNAKMATDIYAQVHALAGALENRKEGIAVLSQKRKVRFMTTKARHYLEKYFGRLQRNDRLPERLEVWVSHEEKRLQANGIFAPQEPLVARLEGSRLTVTAMPAPGQLVLTLSEQILTPDLTALGLTPRESDVLSRVILGKSNEEIAVILGMSPGTVKKHLQHIFYKLGVENRTAAACKARESLDS